MEGVRLAKLRPPARKEENEASGGFVVGDRVLAAGKKGKKDVDPINNVVEETVKAAEAEVEKA